MQKRKIWTIPNILSGIRIIMMPLFLYVYFMSAPMAKWYAFWILAFSFLTDACDGFIARKFNQISDLGKILDPLADKLMQVTVLICLAVSMFEHNIIVTLAVVFVFIKDLLLGIGAVVLYKKGMIEQSNWAGKIACFVSVFVSLLLIFPFKTTLPDAAMYSSVGLLVLANAIALASYIVRYVNLVSKSRTS